MKIAQTKESLFIKEGISKEQINQLIEYSNTDPEILKFTRDKIRFRDQKAYTKWRTKRRIIYTLVDEKNNLLGITWFGKKVKPDYQYFKEFNPQNFSITFSIRLYGEVRGKGLASWFVKETMSLFKTLPEYKKIKNNGFWEEVSKDNLNAIKFYEKIGFKKACKPDSEGNFLMFGKEFKVPQE